MKTDALIRALTADHATRSAPVDRYLVVTVATGFVVSALLFALILSPRPDLAAAVSTPRVLFKFVVSLTLAASACPLMRRLARPAAPAQLLWLAAAPVLLILSVVAELIVAPSATWTSRAMGINWYVCLTMIILLSMPLLAAALMTLRHGAPTRPALAGAVAGLLAGGLAAAIFALYCTNDSPLFLAIWYSLAIAIVGAAGALVGGRVLRW